VFYDKASVKEDFRYNVIITLKEGKGKGITLLLGN